VNIWSQITLQLVLEKDYLDQLQRIYKHEEGERDITQATIDSITNAFNDADADELLAQLLGLEKFPYKDCYVSFLRRDKIEYLKKLKD
jgi:hypothetical protein